MSATMSAATHLERRSLGRRIWCLAIPLLIGAAAFGWSRWSYLFGAVAEAPATVDLGLQENGKLILTDVIIHNVGWKPLQLSRFGGSCPSCISFGLPSDSGPVAVEQLTIGPGKSATLAVRLLVMGAPERPFRTGLSCETNDPRRPELSVVFEAAVKGWVFAEPREIDLGILKPEQNIRRTIHIRDSGRGEPCRFGRVQSPVPDRVQLTLLPASNTVENSAGGG